MEFICTTRNVRMSAKKVREVTRQLLPRKNKKGEKEGMLVSKAKAVLSAIPRKSARFIEKTLNTALHNAEHIGAEWNLTEVQEKVAKFKQDIENHSDENGIIQRKHRHLIAKLAKLETYLDNGGKVNTGNLRIKNAMATSATPLRRWMTRARGGGSVILKRCTHIRITLSDDFSDDQ
jgi:ribosomal protein L22